METHVAPGDGEARTSQLLVLMIPMMMMMTRLLKHDDDACVNTFTTKEYDACTIYHYSERIKRSVRGSYEKHL